MESITESRVEFLEPKLFLIKITMCLDHAALFVWSVLEGDPELKETVFSSRIRRWV